RSPSPHLSPDFPRTLSVPVGSGMRSFGICGCSFHRVPARPHRFLDLLFSRVERVVSHIHYPVLDLGLAHSGQRPHGIGHFFFVSGDANSSISIRATIISSNAELS